MKKQAPSSSSPMAVAMAVVAVAWASSSSGQRAAAEATTIESTYGAAAARDHRVDAGFCARQFAAYHGAAEAAGAWGLARTAALIGVSLGDDAVYDVRECTIRAPPASGARGKAAMRACAQAYDDVGMAFAEAADELGARRYEAAKERYARVEPLARWCDGALAVAGAARTPPPLARYGAECWQIAVIGVASPSPASSSDRMPSVSLYFCISTLLPLLVLLLLNVY